MEINSKSLQKQALYLKEVFETARQVRFDVSKVAGYAGGSNVEGTLWREYFFLLDNPSQEDPNPINPSFNILSQYDWDLEKFFKAVADVDIRLDGGELDEDYVSSEEEHTINLARNRDAMTKAVQKGLNHMAEFEKGLDIS